MAISRFNLAPLVRAFEDNATIIVPSLRIKDAILSEFHNTQINKTYLTPEVVPIDVWVKDQWDKLGFAGIAPFCDRQVLGGVEELFIWTSIIEASRDEISLLNPTETAVQIAQSYQDAQQWELWQHILSDTEHYSANPDVTVFKRWALAFQDDCRKRRLLSLVDSLPFLIDSLLMGNTLFTPAQITLSNFDNPPPLYAKLFDALASVSNITRVGSTDLKVDLSIAGYKFESRDAEIRACAQWALQSITSNADEHIGIIAPTTLSDVAKISRTFNDYFRHSWALDLGTIDPLFNIGSENQALSDEAFIRDALQFLSTFWRDIASQEVCRLLRSEYILPDTEEVDSRMQAELLMRQRFSTSCAQFELAQILDNSQLPSYSPSLARALLNCRTLIRQAPSNASPKQAAGLFKQLLDEMQWPGRRLSVRQQKALQAWEDCLEQFACFDKSAGQMPYPRLLAKLEQLARKTSLRSGFSSRRPLSLYTMSEAQGLRFDRVWLLGFDDQSWPPSASPSPFLPYELQRRFGLPGAHGEIQLAMAENSIAALKAAVAKEMVISYFANEGDQHFRASRLLGEIPLSAKESTIAWPLSRYSETIQGQALTQYFNDVSPPHLNKEERIKGGQSVISNQSSCPFRAFAIHRLNIEPLQGFSRGLDSLARGIAIHIGLENLYKNFDSAKAIKEVNEADAFLFIRGAAKQAVAYLQKEYKRVMTPRFTQLEETRITVLLSLFLELDRQRISFDILAQEKKYIWHYGNLQLTIKIDRIDRLDNGALALIDYKTGKSATKRESWLEQRPEDMQLPFYFAVASAQESPSVDAISIAYVNIEKLEYSGLAANENFIGSVTAVNQDDSFNVSWAELTDLWRHRVEGLAEEFVTGAASVSPVNGLKTCQYCQLQPLCRINEATTDGMLEDEDVADLNHGFNEDGY